MRQICRELWIENHEVGWLAGKAALLAFMLFGNMVRGYPYSIIGIFMLSSMEISSLKIQGQIDYLLPQTEQEIKRNVVVKSALVAGLYSLVNTVGYIGLICRNTEYYWNLELVLFLAYMTVVLFLYYLYYRLSMFCVGNSGTAQKPGQGKLGDSQTGLGEWLGSLVCILSAFLSVFTCLVYVIYLFGKVRFPAVMVQNERAIKAVFGILCPVLVTYAAISRIRKLDYSEYEQ